MARRLVASFWTAAETLRFLGAALATENDAMTRAKTTRQDRITLRGTADFSLRKGLMITRKSSFATVIVQAVAFSARDNPFC